MSIHIEWLDAKSTGIDIIPAGHYINGEPVEDDDDEGSITQPFGLVFSGDDAVVIEGTHEELEHLLIRTIIKLYRANPYALAD